MKSEIKLTNSEKSIIEFWNKRGYHNITHMLGINVNLHKDERYKEIGLSLQYLKQFHEEAQISVIKMMDLIVKKEKERCGEANAVTCWTILKRKVLRASKT